MMKFHFEIFNLMKIQKLRLKKSFFSTIPEEAKIRFPDIKRKCFNKLSPRDVQYFVNVLGKDRVISDMAEVEPYNIDFARHIKGSSEIVLKPKSTEEISSILKYCNENHLGVCPQGGNSGLVSGSVPVFDEIIISTVLMNKIINFNEFSGALTCQSGCILENLDNYLAQYNFMMPIDLGAKGICHIGGNLSTNAGGIRLFRYGNLHGNILGMEVVLADGEILDLLSTVKKDNTGYHLKNLFIGAEGTLGIITKVVIQCPPLPKSITVGLIGLNSFDDVLNVFKQARGCLGEILSACEMMDSIGYDKTIEGFQMNNPFREKYKFYMLLETRSSMDGNDLEKVNNFFEKMMEQGLALNGLVTDEPAKIKQIWEIREKISLAVFKNGYAYKYDISLPHENFYKLVEIMKEKLAGTSATLVTGYGHLGDGNLHLNICSEVYDQKLKEQIEPFIFEVTQKFKGSISAEHGIGLEKPEFLHLSKSKSSIKLMKNIKNLFDPNGILNPYKVLPPSC